MSEPTQQGDREPHQPSAASRTGLAVRGSSLALTNLGKLAGIAIAVNEAVIRSTARDSVIAVAAVLVIGAQVVEEVALHAIDRIFGTTGRGG